MPPVHAPPGFGPEVLSEDDCDEQIARLILGQINASCLDRAVLLAFDAAYREDGTRDEERTLMVTDNDFVAGLAAAGGKCLFGASVHPYRRDALDELERLIEKGPAWSNGCPARKISSRIIRAAFRFTTCWRGTSSAAFTHRRGTHVEGVSQFLERSPPIGSGFGTRRDGDCRALWHQPVPP